MSKVTAEFTSASTLTAALIKNVADSVKNLINTYAETYGTLTNSFTYTAGQNPIYVLLNDEVGNTLAFNMGSVTPDNFSCTTYVIFNEAIGSKLLYLPSSYVGLNGLTSIYVQGNLRDLNGPDDPGTQTAEIEETGSTTLHQYRRDGEHTVTVNVYYIDGTYYVESMSNATPIEYVDLDLPSGTLWADRNLGQSNSTQTLINRYSSTLTNYTDGFYYTWGDINGYPKDAGHSFSASNAKYYQSSTSYYKYNSTDNYTTLLPEDDAAYVATGGVACMPSQAQWQELLDTRNNTIKYTWDTYKINSANSGIIITNNYTNKQLYLSTKTGYYLNSTHFTGCKYWVNSLYTTEINAYTVSLSVINPSNCTIGYLSRYIGLPIRPVLNKKNATTDLTLGLNLINNKDTSKTNVTTGGTHSIVGRAYGFIAPENATFSFYFYSVESILSKNYDSDGYVVLFKNGFTKILNAYDEAEDNENIYNDIDQEPVFIYKCNKNVKYNIVYNDYNYTSTSSTEMMPYAYLDIRGDLSEPFYWKNNLITPSNKVKTATDESKYLFNPDGSHTVNVYTFIPRRTAIFTFKYNETSNTPATMMYLYNASRTSCLASGDTDDLDFSGTISYKCEKDTLYNLMAIITISSGSGYWTITDTDLFIGTNTLTVNEDKYGNGFYDVVTTCVGGDTTAGTYIYSTGIKYSFIPYFSGSYNFIFSSTGNDLYVFLYDSTLSNILYQGFFSNANANFTYTCKKDTTYYLIVGPSDDSLEERYYQYYGGTWYITLLSNLKAGDNTIDNSNASLISHQSYTYLRFNNANTTMIYRTGKLYTFIPNYTTTYLFTSDTGFLEIYASDLFKRWANTGDTSLSEDEEADCALKVISGKVYYVFVSSELLNSTITTTLTIYPLGTNLKVGYNYIDNSGKTVSDLETYSTTDEYSRTGLKYAFIPIEDGSYSFVVNDTDYVNDDTYIYILDSDGSTEIASDDDGDVGDTDTSDQGDSDPALTVDLTAYTTYYIVVTPYNDDNYSDSDGTIYNWDELEADLYITYNG